ncbi:MAG: hypothetical protein E7623_00740 [Ruminococcaceae bacterium]|nr:hypothetical protein [Oscillospiraceae bacterium]
MNRRNTIIDIYRIIVCTVGLISLCLSTFTVLKSAAEHENIGRHIIKSTFFGFLGESESQPTGSDSPFILEGSKSEGSYLISLNEVEDEKQYISQSNVISADISGNPKGEILIKNETSYSINTEIRDSGSVFKAGETKVLIIHTHATEAYFPENALCYESSMPTRSQNTSENVIVIGELIAEKLNEKGIDTLHCKKLHDGESYNDAYSNSLESIKHYLKIYPEIKYIFDIHRDAIIRSDGSLVKPIVGNAAQIMILCGTDEGGGNFPHWRDNLSFAFSLQERLNTMIPNIARPILIRSATYHQQYAERSLLIEMGAFGNTLSETKAAAEIFAEALSDILLSGT